MKTFFSQRRNIIGTAIVGALVLGALGVGILYLVVFPGSSPQKLTLSSPVSSTSASAASSDPAAAAGTWTVASGSQAGYRVREQLASLAAPSDAVGRTSSVHGSITIAASGTTYSVTAASITVDVNTLTSDKSMRDQRIHRMGLESDR